MIVLAWAFAVWLVLRPVVVDPVVLEDEKQEGERRLGPHRPLTLVRGVLPRAEGRLSRPGGAPTG